MPGTTSSAASVFTLKARPTSTPHSSSVRQRPDSIALSAARAPTPVAVREGGISAAKSIANALIAQRNVLADAIQRKQVMEGLEDMAHDVAADVYAKLAGNAADKGALSAKIAVAAKGAR